MKSKTLIIGAALGLSVAAQAAKKPNLIVIMADDLGYGDVGFNGCKDIPTPNIDSIAHNGAMFTDARVTFPVCGPSRAGFITGRYEQRFGFVGNPPHDEHDRNAGVPKSEMNIAESLKQVGYTTGIIGKWHLGFHRDEHHPNKRGFDEFFGHLGGGSCYFQEMLTVKDCYSAKRWESYKTWIRRNNEPVKISKYLTDEFSDEALAFVDRHKEKPFFLYLAYNAPHSPLQATDEYLARFPHITDQKRKTYAAMVSAVDDGVGRLMNHLKSLNLEESTIVWFLSDNGGIETKSHSDNGPLRGQKGTVWEGGSRVPYAVQWKGVVPAGKVYDKSVTSLDIFATISDLAKSPTNPDKPLDGVNLIPFLTGENEEVPHSALYMRMHTSKRKMIRSGDFKYVVPGKGQQAELYNLTKDIGETRNIASQHPEQLLTLEQKYHAWAKNLKDPIFLGNWERQQLEKKRNGGIDVK
jgi:arylsulfatase A-like enzyme